MRYGRIAACLVLGIGLLASGSLKSLDAKAPVLAAAAYGIVPGWVALLLGAVLPALEIVVGLALLTGWQRRAAALWAGVLGVAFAVANGWALAQDLVVDCQCFGGLGGNSLPASLAIDVVVIVLALVAWTAGNNAEFRGEDGAEAVVRG